VLPEKQGSSVTDVTRILCDIEQGRAEAAEQILPLVYDELRRLAAGKLMHEKPGQTLQATALVHEAYLRLVDSEQARGWDSRGHFFAAAAEAMRRILVDNARRKLRPKHGGDRRRVELDKDVAIAPARSAELLALDEALTRLEAESPAKATLVKLRHFGGFTVDEAAELLGISRATAKRYWTYARAWLFSEIGDTGCDEAN